MNVVRFWNATRRITWYVKVLILVAALLVGLFVAETTLYLLGLPRERPFFQEFYGSYFKLMCYDQNFAGNLDIDLRDANQRAPFETALYGDQFRLHWEQTPYAVEVKYNTVGHRAVDFELPKGDVFRIIVIGDDFIYGHGLAAADCFTEKLQALLPARQGAAPVEVLNYGRVNDNLDKTKYVATSTLLNLDPDLLIYCYALNDPHPTFDSYPKGVHPMLDVLWKHEETVGEAPGKRFSLGGWSRDSLRTWRVATDYLNSQSIAAKTLDWFREIHEPSRWEKPAGQEITTMSQKAKQQNCRFILAILPIIWQLDGEYPLSDVHQRISDYVQQREIECVDLLPALRGHADSELMLHPHDRHPNPKYAQIVAETIAEYLSNEE